MSRISAISALMLLAASSAAFAQAPAAPAPVPNIMALSSPSFSDGGVIPDKYTGKSAMPVSPALAWANAPAGVASFTLIMHDPDNAPMRNTTDTLHWMAINIPGTATSLPEGVPNVATLPDGTVQISHRNTIGFIGPGWPGPTSYHHYVAELFALDTKLTQATTATREEVMAATNGHILGRAAYEGRFHR